MKRYFFINYKLEPQAFGRKGLNLSRALFNVDTKKQVIFVPQLVDIRLIAAMYPSSRIFAPHVDSAVAGKGTGYILPEAVREAGASGTILNHAEHKLSPRVLAATVVRAHEAGLQVMICADSLAETKAIIPLHPDFIAYEPPELIGGNTSVATAKPGVVQDFVKMVIRGRSVPIIGAGIKTVDDVRTSVALGACGVFVSSGIVRAARPAAVLQQLLKGLK